MPHQSAFTEWAQGRGFEVRAGTTRIAISSVAIAGDTVQITTATDLPATGVVVGYASTADGTLRPTGRAHWGQLHDSDPFSRLADAGRALAAVRVANVPRLRRRPVFGFSRRE